MATTQSKARLESLKKSFREMQNAIAAVQADLQSMGENRRLESLAVMKERQQAVEERRQHRDKLSEISRCQAEMAKERRTELLTICFFAGGSIRGGGRTNEGLGVLATRNEPYCLP